MPDISTGQAQNPEMPLDSKLNGAAKHLVELSERPDKTIHREDLGLEQEVQEAPGTVPMSAEVATHPPAVHEAARAAREAADSTKGTLEGYRRVVEPRNMHIGNTPDNPGPLNSRVN